MSSSAFKDIILPTHWYRWTYLIVYIIGLADVVYDLTAARNGDAYSILSSALPMLITVMAARKLIYAELRSSWIIRSIALLGLIWLLIPVSYAEVNYYVSALLVSILCLDAAIQWFDLTYIT